MKKMARWALAFAAVMSIPTSAMALVGDHPHNAFIINGRQEVPVGVWRFTLDQLVFAPFDEACAFFVKWVNYAGLPSSANTYVEEVATAGIEDCEENAYFPQASLLRLSTVLYPDLSKGFDKFQQKRALYRIMLAEDAYSGNFSGVIQFHPAAVPYGFKLNPV